MEGKMLRNLKHLILKATGMSQLIKLSEEQSSILANIAWRNLLTDEKYAAPKRLSRFGFNVYSQGEEDGILHEIFRRIGVKHKTFIEIGISNGRDCNTMYFLRQGWKGVGIECNPKRVKEIEKYANNRINSGDLTIACRYVNRENADELLAKLVPYKLVDLLCIDVDGNDYHILKSISSISPRVIVLEYNAIFAPPIEWVMPYNPAHMWDGSDHFGASLKSYELMLSAKGYSLVGCTMNGVNAFFVKSEFVNNHFCVDTSAEYHYEPQRYWITKAFIPGYPFNDRTAG